MPSSEKRIRTLELMLILALAFLPAFISSFAFFSGIHAGVSGPYQANARYIVSAVTFLSTLAVLFYVLLRQGRNVFQLGLAFSWRDIPVALGLVAAAYIATTVFSDVYQMAFFSITHHRANMSNPALGLFEHRLTVWYVLYIIIDPVFEELIMRAYTMTELQYLTGSTAVAVIGSTVLQASYHLYEGIGVFSIGLMFLIFSLYYARYRRIFPVILAHLLWDGTFLVLILAQGRLL